MDIPVNQPSTQARIEFHHPVAFWMGCTIVIAGVLAHIPMFLSAAEMNFRMAGMEMGPLMTVGMYGIVIGTAIVTYGLIPNNPFSAHKRTITALPKTHLKALDESRITAEHWKIFVVLALALIIDVMKPATLGFVMPGSAAEYGLTKAETAYVPLAGILGTTMGSFLWGWLGDSIGRRASILLAAIFFIGTSICGAMPSYSWNVFMCWLMGLGAGGMLPIAFALLAELTPRTQRGWLMVLLGGIGTIGGYLAASSLASLLEPIYSWRIMWFLGLPTGVLLLLMNRFIPESPRFLLAQGNKDAANAVFQRFGIEVSDDPDDDTPGEIDSTPESASKLGELFRLPYTSLTISVGLFALAYGLVNFGFLLWLPTNLRELGMSMEGSNPILARSALIAFPATLIGAWLYHVWSTRGTLAVFAILTSISLGGFVWMGDEIVNHPTLLAVLLVFVLASSSGMIALLSPYTAELFPVQIRSTASGWSAGCSKMAGVISLSASSIGMTAGMTMSAVGGLIPALIAAGVIALGGRETRGISLEQIQEDLHSSRKT